MCDPYLEEMLSEEEIDEDGCYCQVENEALLHLPEGATPVCFEAMPQEEDDCINEFEEDAPASYPHDDEEGDCCGRGFLDDQVALSSDENEFKGETAAEAAVNLEECDEVAVCKAPTSSASPPSKQALPIPADTPQVKVYRQRLEQAIKFNDIDVMAEIVYYIKTDQLEPWFPNLEEIEELVFAD